MVLKVALCGGGNAVHIMAADLGSRPEEYDVVVFAPFADEAARMKAGVEAAGHITKNFRGTQVRGRPSCISNQAADVIPGCDVIILPIPSFAHQGLLEAMAPHVKAGAFVAAMPGQANFDMRARSIFKDREVVLCGFNQLPYQCRITEYGQSAELIGHKAEIGLATTPASKIDEAKTLFDKLLGYVPVYPLGAFLNVTLHPANQTIHPSIMYGLFHAHTTGEPIAEAPLFYQKTDDFTAKVLQENSDEIQTIARALEAALGIDLKGVPEIEAMMRRFYESECEDASTLKSIFCTNRGYAGLLAPMVEVPGGLLPNYKYRYLTEDIPLGQVVLKGYAELVGVSTPCIDKLVLWGQGHMGKEYIVDSKLAGKDVGETAAPQAFGITTLEDLKKQF